MFQRKPRRFRHRSNGRGRHHHGNGQSQTRLRSNSFSNSQARNSFRPTQSPEKLLEKYNLLAKEAMSSGDVTSCENFLQHADHFARIIEEKNKDQSKTNIVNKSVVDDKQPTENSEIKQEDTTQNKD